MPTTCKVTIEGVHAGPPYVLGNQPASITVVGRTSEDCNQVRLVIRIAGAGSPAIVDQIVAVDFPANQPGQLPGLVRKMVPLPQVGLTCGDPLYVEMTSTHDATCSDSGQFAIECKPHPSAGSGPGNGNGGAPPDGDNGGGNGWTWPPWPGTRCGWTAAGAAMGFIAALASLAIGIGTQNAPLIAAAIAIAALAGLSWALWTFWCERGFCARRIILCWVFKRAFIATLPVIAFSSSALIVLVLVGYGALAGILVNVLRERGCPVPSARSPFNHLPI